MSFLVERYTVADLINGRPLLSLKTDNGLSILEEAMKEREEEEKTKEGEG
jgi:hypothetical protein